MYDKILPGTKNLLWLSKLARPFPASATKLVQTASKWNLSRNTIDFVSLFPSDVTFASGDDFLTRCEELRLMIREERAMPVEKLHNPQD